MYPVSEEGDVSGVYPVPEGGQVGEAGWDSSEKVVGHGQEFQILQLSFMFQSFMNLISSRAN